MDVEVRTVMYAVHIESKHLKISIPDLQPHLKTKVLMVLLCTASAHLQPHRKVPAAYCCQNTFNHILSLLYDKAMDPWFTLIFGFL